MYIGTNDVDSWLIGRCPRSGLAMGINDVDAWLTSRCLWPGFAMGIDDVEARLTGECQRPECAQWSGWCVRPGCTLGTGDVEAWWNGDSCGKTVCFWMSLSVKDERDTSISISVCISTRPSVSCYDYLPPFLALYFPYHSGTYRYVLACLKNNNIGFSFLQKRKVIRNKK